MASTHDIHTAAQRGDVDTLTFVLASSPALLQARNESGLTPYLSACLFGQERVVQLLLDHGVSEVEEMGTMRGETGLHLAATGGRVSLIHYLLGRCPGLIDRGSYTGYTPLMSAVRANSLAAVQALVALGANVNQADLSGETPLAAARLANAVDIIAFLLQHNAFEPNVEASGAEYNISGLVDTLPRLSLDEETNQLLGQLSGEDLAAAGQAQDPLFAQQHQTSLLIQQQLQQLQQLQQQQQQQLQQHLQQQALQHQSQSAFNLLAQQAPQLQLHQLAPNPEQQIAASQQLAASKLQQQQQQQQQQQSQHQHGQQPAFVVASGFGRAATFPGDLAPFSTALHDIIQLPMVTVNPADMSSPTGVGITFTRSMSKEQLNTHSPPGSPSSIGSINSDIDISGDEDLIAKLGFRVIMNPINAAGMPALVSQGSNPDLLMPPQQAMKQKKIYACTFCNKTFSCSSNMTRHRRIHTGQRPYKCAFCEHSFSNSSNRRKHEKSCQKRQEGQAPSDRRPGSTSPASSVSPSLSPASSQASLVSDEDEPGREGGKPSSSKVLLSAVSSPSAAPSTALSPVSVIEPPHSV